MKNIALTPSQQAVAETLDLLIKEKAFKIAIECLGNVRDTFPLYDEYLALIGRLL